MPVEEAIALVQRLLKRLTKVQEIIFRQSWAGQTYLDMAVNEGYDPGYIKDVGSGLWRSLSTALNQKVSKNNLQGVIKQFAQNEQNQRVALKDVNNSIQDYKSATTFGGNTIVALSPNGAYLTASNTNNEIQIWDAATGQCLQSLQGHTSIVTAIAFSPDSQLIASSSRNHTVKIWHVTSGACIQTLEGYYACVWTVIFHPTTPILATVGEANTVKLWELQTACYLKTLQEERWIMPMIKF
jgi:WD40 repeat protein